MTPAVDYWESEAAIRIEVELPGVPPTGLSSNSDGRSVTVHGVPTREDFPGLDRVYSEYEPGDFCRHLPLPEDADTGKAECRMNNGILTLHIPRHPGNGSSPQRKKGNKTCHY